MRKYILIPMLMVTTLSAMSQTVVTSGVMNGKKYGVTYMLPKTQIQLTIKTTKHTLIPGEFSKYARRYLNLDNVVEKDETYFTLDEASIDIIGTPDEDKLFFVELKDKTIAPLMELTNDGIIKSINYPRSENSQSGTIESAAETTPSVNAQSFYTEEMLMANSTLKRAELVAKEIFNIRESKNALIKGEAENMPKDGQQLKLMLEQLNIQEEAFTELFKGKMQTQTIIQKEIISPEVMDNYIPLRFSRKLGIIEKGNLAGEPLYLSIKNLGTIDTTEANLNKKTEGIAYNVPGRALVTLAYQHADIAKEELPISQFGIIEYLSPVLFNKNTTTMVQFDIRSGALLKVDRGEISTK